ncbi:uncharacterized protein LOC135843785 [Planococcus citri]|uniref:uncharacterized protein LOC135843785 n=1 Tax=Planococcus citri TaxID=170843 RepID=UPI0031F84547
MNFKLFSHLTMAHLVSGWWSVLCEDSNEGILDSNDQKLLKKLTYDPNLYQEVGDTLIGLKQESNKKREEVAQLYYAVCEENKNYHAENHGMLKYIQAVKIRDWIVDLETEFPIWLRDLEVDRFIKWVLALNFVERPIFDDLRNRLQKSPINVDEFANEMYSMVEETSSFYANLSEVPKPKQAEIPRLCEIIIGGEKERKAACKILLSTICGDRTKYHTINNNIISSSIADTYPTKFYLIITQYKKLNTEDRIGFDQILKNVTSNSEFNNQKCAILESLLLVRSQTDGQEQKTTLPTIVIRIGCPINIRGLSCGEFKENYPKLRSVMNAIKTDQEELLRAEQSGGNILTQDDYISQKWLRFFESRSITADSTGKGNSKEPSR